MQRPLHHQARCFRPSAKRRAGRRRPRPTPSPATLLAGAVHSALMVPAAAAAGGMPILPRRATESIEMDEAARPTTPSTAPTLAMEARTSRSAAAERSASTTAISTQDAVMAAGGLFRTTQTIRMRCNNRTALTPLLLLHPHRGQPLPRSADPSRASPKITSPRPSFLLASIPRKRRHLTIPLRNGFIKRWRKPA